MRWPHAAHILPGGLYVACPCDLGLRQHLVALAHSQAAGLTTDEHGNHWLLFELTARHQDVHFSYQASVSTSPLLFAENAFGDNITPALACFVQAERGIEATHPTIVALAQKITARTPIAILEQAFTLVRKTLRYRVQPQEYGALYAASHGQGDCTEYASLFAALLRYHNIGARITIGYMPGGVLHAIAEAYLDGMWIPLDVTNAPEFMLGLSYEFIAMMRANWMSADRIEKLISFYYGITAGSRSRPAISLTANLCPQPSGKVIVLGDVPLANSANSRWPHQTEILPLIPWLQCTSERQPDGYRLRLRHDCSHVVRGHVLLLAGDTVNRIYSCTVESGRETSLDVPLADCRPLWREWRELELVFIDSAEQGHLLATLPKPPTVTLSN